MVVQSNSGRIDWAAKGKARIAQNVRNLVGTYRYEVAYHRTMGLPAGVIDRTSDAAIAELGVEVRRLIARYEPRARVEDVVCTADDRGEIQIEVILQ